MTNIVKEGVKNLLADSDNMNQFIKENKKSFNEYANPLGAYKEFENKFYRASTIKKSLSNFESCFLLNDGVGVACLNSAWMAWDDDKSGKLILGQEQLDASISFLKDAKIKIAVMHHSLNDLEEKERECIEKKLIKNFDILLTGHKHKEKICYQQTFQGAMLNCQSASSIADFSDMNYGKGYSIIDYEKKDKVVVHYRKYLADNERFVVNSDVGNDDGSIEISFPQEKQIKDSELGCKIIDYLKDESFESVDERLFTYGIDSRIPSKMKDLFVEPLLSNFPESQEDSKNVVFYHIQDIIENFDNYLICGLKESGKTTLLDKIFIEYIENFNKLKIIPVRINYVDVKIDGLSRLIQQNLGITKKEYDFLMNQKKNIVLIVDGICFDDDERTKVIVDYLENNINCKIITACEIIADSWIPLNLPNIGLFSKVIYIRNFKSQQIKSLIEKWFPGQNRDAKDRVMQLIKNFQTLSLPRTPLAVTLFLWIIDKQESTPINNSVLVQLVVENLLEKTHFENIYQNKFTYQNKIRLLAFLAMHMEKTGDSNNSYRLSYADALNFVDNYLASKIELSSKKIVDDFSRRGILVIENDSYVKFKYDFFFRYFLALYIEYSSEFKKNIFTQEKCLDYFEEIIYYSGLHTDCEELLELGFNVLSNCYDEINNELLLDPQKLDVFLNSRPSISTSISMEKIEKKPTEEEMNQAYDDELSRIPIKKAIEKRTADVEKSIVKALKFTSFLFKNLEEVDNKILRKNVLKKVFVSSISMLLTFHDNLIRYYTKNKMVPANFPSGVDFLFFIRMLPYLHQVMLSDWIGTEKTKLLIKEKIEDDKNDPKISEYEKYLGLFVYSDIKGKDAQMLYRKFLLENKYKYIMDLGVMKLIMYYYIRSKAKESDLFYLNLIADLKQKLKREKNFVKSKYIQHLKNDKKKYSKS